MRKKFRDGFFIISCLVLVWGGECDDKPNPPQSPIVDSAISRIVFDSHQFGPIKTETAGLGQGRLVSFEDVLVFKPRTAFEGFHHHWDAQVIIYSEAFSGGDVFACNVHDCSSTWGYFNDEKYEGLGRVMIRKVSSEDDGRLLVILGSRRDQSKPYYESETCNLRPVQVIVRVLISSSKGVDRYLSKGVRWGSPAHNVILPQNPTYGLGLSEMDDVEAANQAEQLLVKWREQHPQPRYQKLVADQFSGGVCGLCSKVTDSDGDMTADCVDACPLDDQKTVPGICGCGIPDTDTDQDGLPDCLDPCPNNRFPSCVFGDSDGDGDVDQDDFGLLQRCFGQDNSGSFWSGCRLYDFDRDNLVSVSDVAILQNCRTRSGVPGICKEEPH